MKSIKSKIIIVIFKKERNSLCKSFKMHLVGSGWGKGEHKKIRASGSYRQELVIYAVQGWWWDTGCEAQAPEVQVHRQGLQS